MTPENHSGSLAAALHELRHDPSLMLALGTGTALTAFLVTVHACCVGLSTPHFAALMQICTTAG